MTYPPKTLWDREAAKYSHFPIIKEVKNLPPPRHVLKSLLNHRMPFLLESPKSHPVTARYSFVGADPFLIFKSKGSDLWIESEGRVEEFKGLAFETLRKRCQRYRSPRLPEGPPFTGGAVGLLSYEARHFFETLPKRAKDDLLLPDMIFLFVDRLVAYDHLKQTAWLLYLAETKDPFQKAVRKALDWMEALEDELKQTSVQKCEIPVWGGEVESHMSRETFEEMVFRAKRYIRSGDIFQANLSQRLSSPYPSSPYPLYCNLQKINPSPFSCYADFGDFAIVSSSPERLLRKQGEWVETRPIAGTRPRGKTALEDIEKSFELILSEKERAEHLMLVDLERNDLGRVCRYGTVKVDELMVLEKYSHVIHIVSNVRGRLEEGKDGFDLIRAAFPGGTITGTPKVRCMEIIDELEPVARGPYTGSFGYIGFNGDLDLNILIRSFVLKGGQAYIQVGSGIVADSDPSREYEESLFKAQALLLALPLRQEALVPHAV